MGEKFVRSFTTLGLPFTLVSNYRSIIFDDEYFKGSGGHLHSLLSNFQVFHESNSTPPAFTVILNNTNEGPLRLETSGTKYIFSGPIQRYEEQTDDKRLSIFGNMGIFSKIVVLELERAGVFSFHSTSFVVPDTNHLILVLGGSGTGKSTVLLKAVQDRLWVFGTELTHFRLVGGSVEFLKGSLWQNSRLGNLVEDFPELLDRFGIGDLPSGDLWQQYRSIDFHDISSAADSLVNPPVTILFPRIESNRRVPTRTRADSRTIAYSLYENLAEKVSPPSHLYKRVFVPSLDTGEDQVRRMAAAESFITTADIRHVWKSLTGPADCLEGVV